MPPTPAPTGNAHLNQGLPLAIRAVTLSNLPNNSASANAIHSVAANCWRRHLSPWAKSPSHHHVHLSFWQSLCTNQRPQQGQTKLSPKYYFSCYFFDVINFQSNTKGVIKTKCLCAIQHVQLSSWGCSLQSSSSLSHIKAPMLNQNQNQNHFSGGLIGTMASMVG